MAETQNLLELNPGLESQALFDAIQRRFPGRLPYRDEFFPTSRFRQAYRELLAVVPMKANETYFRILSLAANGSTADVDAALEQLIKSGAPITPSFVQERLRQLDGTRRAGEAAITNTNRSADLIDRA